jgi:glutaredoxin-like YruB-family protein
MYNVEIYTSETCHYCHDAKEFLRQNNIEFIEHNISKDIEARKALIKKGYMSVPLIIIENQEILGFNRDRISKLLQL